MRDRPALTATLLGVIVLLTWSVLHPEPAALTDFPLDDAWIHQVYVRGLLQDGAPTYNPGEAESGFSSALWLVALLPAHTMTSALDVSPVFGAKLISLLCAIWAALALARLAGLLGGGRLARHAAAALGLLTPGLAFSAVSGMEVSLTAALVAQTLSARLRGLPWATGVWAGLACLARPEAAVVGVIVAGHAAWEAGKPRERLGRLARLALPAAAFGALWAAWNLAATGHPLPNTFYVKAASGDLASRADYFLQAVLLGSGLLWAGVAVLLFAVGVFRSSSDPDRRGPLLLLLAALAGTTLAGVAVHDLPEHTRFYGQRYYYPFLALALVPMALGLESLLNRLPNAAARLAGALVIVACLVPASVDAWDSYGAHCRDIALLHTTPALDAATHTPPDAVIAAEGAGASRFLSDRHVVDLVGLNFHALAHAQGDTALGGCLILARNPTWFLVPDFWAPVVAQLYEVRETGRWTSPEWSVVGGHASRTVVALEARPRLDALDRCRERLSQR